MPKLAILILLFYQELALFSGTKAQKVTSNAGPQYITLAKCSFVVFGEFTYDQAKAACDTRQGSLAFFTTPSEDHTVRKNIAWSSMPGYQNGQNWVGQLWIGIQRQQSSPNGWVWDSPIMPGVPVQFTSWVSNSAQSQSSSGNNCVVIREDGWVPFNCNGSGKSYAGALCTAASRTVPGSTAVTTSNNYCNAFLMPLNPSNIALPMVIKKNYFLVKGDFTHDQAASYCACKNGQLSTARSVEEFQFIAKNIDFSSVGFKAWLGLKRATPGSSTFNWIDGMPNTYTTPFLDNPPSPSPCDCAAYDRTNDGTFGWRAFDCSSQTMSALCESFSIL